MQRSFARWTQFAIGSAMMMALAACNSQDSAAPPAAAETSAPVADAGPSLAPPGEQDFKDAWAGACSSAKPVATALCKSKGMTDPNFTCDFGLGDDEYRRHTAELTRGQDRWELADAEQACKVDAA